MKRYSGHYLLLLLAEKRHQPGSNLRPPTRETNPPFHKPLKSCEEKATVYTFPPPNTCDYYVEWLQVMLQQADVPDCRFDSEMTRRALKSPKCTPAPPTKFVQRKAESDGPTTDVIRISNRFFLRGAANEVTTLVPSSHRVTLARTALINHLQSTTTPSRSCLALLHPSLRLFINTRINYSQRPICGTAGSRRRSATRPTLEQIPNAPLKSKMRKEQEE